MGQNTTTRRLPLLNNLKIATPCSESWDGMVGDDQVRFCGGCLKNVYNISAMTTREAQELIADKEGDVCIRMFQRRDGTLINADCPVGIRRQRAQRFFDRALDQVDTNLFVVVGAGHLFDGRERPDERDTAARDDHLLLC